MMTRARVFDLLLGAFVGILSAGATSMWIVGRSVTALEVEMRFMRRDLDALLARPTGTTTLDVLPGGDIQRSIATGENER